MYSSSSSFPRKSGLTTAVALCAAIGMTCAITPANAAIVDWTGNWTGNDSPFANLGVSGQNGADQQDTLLLGRGSAPVGRTLRSDRLTNDMSGVVALAGREKFSSIENAGELSVTKSARVDAGQTRNSGIIEISDGAKFYSRSVTQTDGALLLNQARMKGDTNVLGGLLAGAGRIQGDVVVGQNAFFDVGTPQGNGLFDVSGNLDLLGTTIIDITSSSNFDQVAVRDTLTLGGTLSINFDESFNPLEGQSFTLFDAASINGSFADVIFPEVDGLAFSLTFDREGRTVFSVHDSEAGPAAVPLPAPIWLLGTAVFGLAAARRRKNAQAARAVAA